MLSFAVANGGAGGSTGSIDTTGATFLAAIGVADSSTPNITDSKGNTWVTALTPRGGSFPTYHQAKIYYVVNPTVGTGHTFNVAGTNASAVFAAFDATVVPNVFDAEAGAQRLGVSSATGGSVSPAGSGYLMLSGLGMESASVSPSIGSSFTIAGTQPHVGGVSYGCSLAYKYVTGAEDPSWTLGGTFDVTVVNATFQGSGGGPPSAPGGPVLRGRALTPGRIFGGSALMRQIEAAGMAWLAARERQITRAARECMGAAA
ncbi:MAG: hypothetical protein ACYC2H_01225 [Thermoplasmatota archaeon]